MTRAVLISVLLAGLFGLSALNAPLHAQQAMWRMPFFFTDSNALASPPNPRINAYFGVHPGGSNQIDVLDTLRGFTDHWEAVLPYGIPYTTSFADFEPPPVPPDPAIDIRIQNVSGDRTGLAVNIQKYNSATQVDTFKIAAKPYDSQALNSALYEIPSVAGEYCDSIVIEPRFNGVIRRVNLTKSGGRYVAVPDDGGLVSYAFNLYVYHPKPGPGAPAQLTAISPPDGSTLRELVETLQWNAPALADSYHVQLSSSPGFTGLNLDQKTVTNSAVTPSLQGGTKYYWRALVYNQYGLSYYPDPPFSYTTKPVVPDTVPRLLPTKNLQNVALSPVFRWGRPVSQLAITSYEFQLSLNSSFSSLLKDTVLTDTTLTLGPLQNCNTYYWRVKASNSAGPGNYEAEFFPFRTVLATPSTPTQTGPADGATGVNPSAQLSWTIADVCADNIRIEIVKDTTNPGALYLRTSAVSSPATVGPLGQDTVYYWRIKSYNTLDSSAATGWRSFRTALAPAAAPALVFPAANDTTVQPTDTFRWRKSAYTDHYHLQVATDAAFASLVVNDSTLTDTSRVVNVLFNCTGYFYRLRSINNSGSAGFTATRSFRTRTAAPDPPNLVSPVDNKDSLIDQPTLSWTAGGACTGAYTVHVSKFADFSDTAFITTTAALTVTVGPIHLLGNTDYYWRVRSFNGVGTGPYASRHFKTTPFVQPDPPALTFPPNGANDLPSTVTLQWDSAARASTYRVQISVDTGFAALILNDSTIVQQNGVLPSRIVSNLPNSSTIYWRVSAKNSAGTSAFTGRRSFNTLFPPGAVILIRPADGATGVPVSQSFQWSVPDHADGYELQVARDAGFTSMVYGDTGLQQASWSLPANALKSYSKYYWRARAKNSVGWGSYSPTYSFITERTGVAAWSIPLRVQETGPAFDVVYFGVDPFATSGIDPTLGEYELPPPSFGWFDARFISPAVGQGVRIDYLKFSTYGQIDTFMVSFQPGIGTYPMTLSWPGSMVKTVCDSMVLSDQLTGGSFRVRMDKDSSYSIANAAIGAAYIIEYGTFPLPEGVAPGRPPIPKGFVLFQNYPNPFNPSTRIQFSTDKRAEIEVVIYDILGREVRTVASGTFPPGIVAADWDGRSSAGSVVPSGVYYMRMKARAEGSSDYFVSTRKMMMLK